MAKLSVLSPEQLRAELKEDRWWPVYLLAGADTFRAESTAQWLKQKCMDPGMGDLNIDTLWADEKTPAQIVETVSAFAMFGGRRMVWVRHAEELPAGDAMRPLLEYLEDPSPDNILVFTSQKLDKRLKFTTACTQRGRVVEFAPLRGGELRAQVRRQARGLELDLAPDSVEALLDLVGEDLAEIQRELEKLSLAVETSGETGALDAETVRRAVAGSRDIDAFELADAMDPAQARQALRRWWEMRSRGSDVYGASAVLMWRFRQLLQLRTALDGGLDARDAARVVGLSPWQAKRVLPLVQALSADFLEKTLQGFLRAEGRAKGTSLDADLAYDLAILDWAVRSDS